MKWRDRRQSSNVDDRRSSSGRSGGGRGMPSIGTLMFLWPIVKPLLKSKLGLAVVGIGAVGYFMMPSFMGGGGSSQVANEAADSNTIGVGDLDGTFPDFFLSSHIRTFACV